MDHTRGSHPPGDVTRLLRQLGEGEDDALDRLLPLVYRELRLLARRQMAREYAPPTLQPTGLVHEAYLKLAAGQGVRPVDRSHFLALAARAMRQVLVDHARRRNAERHGGGWVRVTLTDGPATVELDPDEVLALDEALGALEPRQRRIVEGRFFGGMTEEELGRALGVSTRTVRRDWVKARAWLYRTLYPEPASS